ncbi:uncharacterized protein LOC112047839 [Bicyclus anynana]|uniref:Uncharacterized protein LOC112047839 n=1 Tax=Bicyclus anynana TaxID=110368 RepID=A0ABM3M5N2_BICAN|nr:uncharacterized protein LOC112047839 [Bicyclus anynana]
MPNDCQCPCIHIIGHLDDVKWLQSPRKHKPSRNPLSICDWTQNYHIWLHYVESADGSIVEDDILRSTDTRYWSIHDVQRYYLGDLHCEQVLFTYQYPNLQMPTTLGSFFWKANTALKLPPALYLKELHRSIEHTLRKMEVQNSQMDRLIISDQLIKIDRLDCFKRKSFFKSMKHIISSQDRLQLVSLENLCCKRLEGIELLQTLACFVADTLKYLFLWRFVLPNENPILINYRYITGSGQYIDRPDIGACFLRCLAELRNLRVLALEYAHIADGIGYALLSLLPILRRPHFRLQLICREDQIPGRTDAALGVGGYDIPDTAWRRVAIACPDLYLFMAFFRIRDYDNVRRFLTPSIPLREVHLQYGIDLNITQRQDSDVSYFIRHLAYRYADTLVTLSIHQWRTVEVPMRCIFELMPRLVRFQYTGLVNLTDLHDALIIISCGVCEKLKQINIQIQDEDSNRCYMKKLAEKLTEEFQDIMELYDISFCINIYKS